MPEFHSKVVGSSTAYRRMNCPGSQELEAKVPDDGGSSYAREGTALHKVMEDWIDTGAGPALGDFINEDVPAITKEQLHCVEWCFNIVDPIIGENEFALEQYLEFPGIEGAGGTGDLVVFHEDGSVDILDYKFGQGVVTAQGKGRYQLLFVAGAVAAKYGAAHTYRLHILQPRVADGHTMIEVTSRDVEVFVAQLQEAVRAFRPEYLPGEWCKFCKGEAVCPAKMQLAQEIHNWRALGHADLPKALSMVDEIEEWAASVRKLAHSALEHGSAIQGWKLVNKRGTRKWALPDSAIRRRLSRAGLKVDAYAPRETITPAQAEKAGAVLKDDMVEVKVSGTTLARASDPREAVNKGPRDLQALANAISATKKG